MVNCVVSATVQLAILVYFTQTENSLNLFLEYSAICSEDCGAGAVYCTAHCLLFHSQGIRPRVRVRARVRAGAREGKGQCIDQSNMARARARARARAMAYQTPLES